MKMQIKHLKRRLTPDQWTQFENETDITAAVRLVADALQIGSENPDVNPFLRHVQSLLKINRDEVVDKAVKLTIRSTTSEITRVTSKLTRLIAAMCASSDSSLRQLSEIYRLRSHVFLLSHEKVLKKKGRHQKGSFVSALVDLECSAYCDRSEHSSQSYASIPDVRQLRRRIRGFSDRCQADECDKWCKQFPTHLRRENDSSAVAEKTVTTLDEGYRSAGSSPIIFEVYLKNNNHNNISICKSPTRGRFLRAARSFSPGDVVLSEAAFVSSLYPQFQSYRCNSCFRSITESVAKCPKNCPIVFCSTYCLKQAEEVHRLECPVIGITLSEQTRFRLAILFFLKCQRRQGNYLMAEQLAHHFRENSASYRFALTVKALSAAFVLSEMGALDIGRDLRNGCELMSSVCLSLCQIETNSVRLEKRIGSAIFTNFSLACHSCQPNMLYTYRNSATSGHPSQLKHRPDTIQPYLWLTANQSISAGTELTISYGSGPTFEERRQRMASNYFFHCSCALCLCEMRARTIRMDLRVSPAAMHCSSCQTELRLIEPDASSSNEESVFSCVNKLCCMVDEVINFERKASFCNDYLRNAIILMQNERISPDDDPHHKSLTNCIRHFGTVSKLFQQPNLLQMDFAVFITKLYFHMRLQNEFVAWAKESFRISFSLLGFHPEAAACFHRLVLAFVSDSSFDALSRDDKKKWLGEMFLLMDITKEQQLYFNEEVPLEQRTNLMTI